MLLETEWNDDEGRLITKPLRLPPSPPPDRYWVNGRRVRSIEEIRIILKERTYVGDLLRLEVALRAFKRAVFQQLKPVLRPILKYLKL